MLSAKRDISAAKRFFNKLMRADHRRLPSTISTNKHASYPEAFAVSIKEKVRPFDCMLRRVKYLNDVIEQDHRAIRRRWRAAQCFRSYPRKNRLPRGGDKSDKVDTRKPAQAAASRAALARLPRGQGVRDLKGLVRSYAPRVPPACLRRNVMPPRMTGESRRRRPRAFSLG
jgi:hypothetical protein